MVEIVAYKCVDTGRIFEFEPDYRQHRARLLHQRRRERDVQVRVLAFDAQVQHLRETATSFEDISEWIQANISTLLARTSQKNHRKFKGQFELKSFEFENMRFCDQCSNSHSAPIGEKTNWHGTPDLPRGFPGWRGQAVFTYDGDTPWFLTDTFDIPGINFGSGGGVQYRGEMTLFEQDWPGIVAYQRLTQGLEK